MDCILIVLVDVIRGFAPHICLLTVPLTYQGLFSSPTIYEPLWIEVFSWPLGMPGFGLE